MGKLYLYRVISGGQRGADQGFLRAAKVLSLETGGTAPLGYKVQTYDGRVAYDAWLKPVYGLEEWNTADYPSRTRLNVYKADATVWVGYTESAGYRCTAKACRDFGKPIICNPTPAQLVEFLELHQVGILNGAGNRHSEHNPSAGQQAYDLLFNALAKNYGENFA